MVIEPGSEGLRAMPTGIVQDHDHLSARPVSPEQLAKEDLKRRGIELWSDQRAQPSVGRTDRPEHSGLLSRGCMEDDRVDVLGRNPHRAARAMLLEMAFVFEP